MIFDWVLSPVKRVEPLGPTSLLSVEVFENE